MNFHRRVEHFRRYEPEEIGLRPEARRADAEALLAELKRLLDEEQTPASNAHKSSSKAASAAFSSLWELSGSDAAAGASPSGGEAEVDGKSGASSGDQLSGVERIIAERPFPADQSVRLGSRKRKLLVSGLALSVVTAIGAGLVFKGDLPDLSKNSSPVANALAPAPVEPAMAVAPAPAGVAGFARKDEPAPEHAGGSNSELQSKTAPAGADSPPTASAVGPQFSGERASEGAAAANTVDAPIATEPAAAATTAISQPQYREPPQEASAKPEGAPEATGALPHNATAASGATGFTAPAAAVKLPPQPASRADVSAERAPSARNAPVKPTVAKRTKHKTAAKKASATGNVAEAPKQRLDAAAPNASTAEPAAAVASPGPTPNEQQQGGLTGAFGYLVHLPAALIQRATNPNEAK